MKIEEFLSKNNKISFPTVQNGNASSVEDFYENCIISFSQQNKESVLKWHHLLVRYVEAPESVLLSRLYESRKNNGKWDTRRGMLTRMADGFSFAFATNFFARLIFTMAYCNYVPEYNDFKDMFLKKKFSLYSFMGTTDIEKKYSAFRAPVYNQQFYTHGWYLAHIIAVNDDEFAGYKNVDIKSILTPGNVTDWKETPRGYYLRQLDYILSVADKKIVKAHFLRFLDPLNYFLVPSSSHISDKKIGENKQVLKFMRKKYFDLYQDDYKDFLIRALAPNNAIPKQDCSILGKIKIDVAYWNENQKINLSPIKNKNKTIDRREHIPPFLDIDINDDFLKKIKHYREGEINKGFSETTFNYENEYIKTICFTHSNKWINDTEMEKMWSIIFSKKKDFSNLHNWKTIEELFKANITEVSKGKHKGCYGLRIHGMKQRPNERIIKEALDYIFES